MSQKSYDGAKQCYISHGFSREGMETDGSLEFYLSFGVPEGQEKQWRLEYVDGLLSELKRCAPDAGESYAVILDSLQKAARLFQKEQVLRLYELLSARRMEMSADDALAGLQCLNLCSSRFIMEKHNQQIEALNTDIADWAELLTGYASDSAALDQVKEICEARLERFTYQHQNEEFNRLNAELGKCGRFDFSRKTKLTKQLIQLRQQINLSASKINARVAAEKTAQQNNADRNGEC